MDSSPYPNLVAAVISGWRLGPAGKHNMRPVYKPDGALKFYGRSERGILFYINRFQRQDDRRARIQAT